MREGHYCILFIMSLLQENTFCSLVIMSSTIKRNNWAGHFWLPYEVTLYISKATKSTFSIFRLCGVRKKIHMWAHIVNICFIYKPYYSVQELKIICSTKLKKRRMGVNNWSFRDVKKDPPVTRTGNRRAPFKQQQLQKSGLK